MKCLSLKPPWGTLIAIGAKQIESRGWPMRYRGDLAIHQSSKWEKDDAILTVKDPTFVQALEGAGYCRLEDVPLGAILAVVTVYDCRSTNDTRWTSRLTPQEDAFGNYEPHRFGFFLRDLRRLSRPVPARGSLGLWETDAWKDGLPFLDDGDGAGALRTPFSPPPLQGTML